MLPGEETNMGSLSRGKQEAGTHSQTGRSAPHKKRDAAGNEDKDGPTPPRKARGGDSPSNNPLSSAHRLKLQLKIKTRNNSISRKKQEAGAHSQTGDSAVHTNKSCSSNADKHGPTLQKKPQEAGTQVPSNQVTQLRTITLKRRKSQTGLTLPKNCHGHKKKLDLQANALF
jgi:hypothetical protein